MRKLLQRLLFGKEYHDQKTHIEMIEYQEEQKEYYEARIIQERLKHKEEIRVLLLQHGVDIANITFYQQKALEGLAVMAHEHTKLALEANQLAAAIPNLDSVLYKWIYEAVDSAHKLGLETKKEYEQAYSDFVNLSCDQAEILGEHLNK